MQKQIPNELIVLIHNSHLFDYFILNLETKLKEYERNSLEHIKEIMTISHDWDLLNSIKKTSDIIFQKIKIMRDQISLLGDFQCLIEKIDFSIFQEEYQLKSEISHLSIKIHRIQRLLNLSKETKEVLDFLKIDNLPPVDVLKSDLHKYCDLHQKYKIIYDLLYSDVPNNLSKIDLDLISQTMNLLYEENLIWKNYGR